MKHPIRRRFMYLGFQLLRVVAQWLPFKAAQAFGRGLGIVGYAALADQRRLAQDHLARAFGPGLAAAQRRRLARDTFVNLGQNAMEWLAFPGLSAQDLRRLVVSEGVDHVRQALSRGSGAILLTAHFGNWELISIYLRQLGFEGGVLARRLRYSEYEAFLIALRGQYGVPTFARGSIREVASVLRANQIIGVLPDQDIDTLEGIFINFFGRPAYTPVGPAALSLMTGAPILPCFLIREAGRFRLVIEPPVQVVRGADRVRAVAALTQAWSDVIESYIRRYPGQWVWMHRRWKTQPTTQPGGESAAAGRLGEPQREAEAGQPARPFREIRSAHGRSPDAILSVALLVACSLLAGCLNARGPKAGAAHVQAAQSDEEQAMSSFTLTGYERDGTKRWMLEGEGANAEGHLVTIQRPDGVGYDATRTAYLTAGIAQINQTNRHVRLEHEVIIHTSDGLWFASPVLHWIPDQNEFATELPVRIETDHMLLRGRAATGTTHLKQAKVLRDVEVVLNPSDQDVPDGQPKHVTITCDGPLSFDYERQIATFERNVHVRDPNGDLFSDQLVAHLDEASHAIRYAEAMGHVRIHQNHNTAVSERAVYEPTIGRITLVGRPSLMVYPSESDRGTALSFGSLSSDAPGPSKPSAPLRRTDASP